MDSQMPYFGSPENTPIQQSNLFLYCWGKNKDGELSIGTVKYVSNPKPVRGLKNIQVLQISSGSQHSALVTQDGKILICGSALHSKLGLEEQNQPNYIKFQQITLLNHLVVVQVACGDYHTLCLSNNGEVYSWGGTLHKKVGQRGGRPGPIQSLQNKQIIYIDCGDFHSAALTMNGDIYTWGGGGRDYNRGQLGHGHLNDVELPEKVKFSQECQIQKLACGGYHMMALDQLGELWSWGQGMYGETGLGEFQDYAIPKKVTVSFNQKSVIVDDLYLSASKQYSGHHSIILNNKGIVYTCGFAQYGQLGLKTKENQNRFQLVLGLLGKNVIKIAAGWNHSVVLTQSRDIYTCGYNAAGQLGVGDEESRIMFTHVQNLASKNISSIFAGGSHTWAIIDSDYPNIDNYNTPSPIKDEPGQQYYQIKDVTPLDLNQSQEKFVEILVSEVELYHRFIKIKFNYSNEPNFKLRLNEYLSLIQKDQTSKLVKCQCDSEVLGKQISPTEESYTIMIVSSVKSQEQYENDMELISGQSTSIGQQLFAKVNSLRGAKWGWIINAEKIFQSFQVKYFEMRPNVQ